MMVIATVTGFADSRYSLRRKGRGFASHLAPMLLCTTMHVYWSMLLNPIAKGVKGGTNDDLTQCQNNKPSAVCRQK